MNVLLARFNNNEIQDTKIPNQNQRLICLHNFNLFRDGTTLPEFFSIFKDELGKNSLAFTENGSLYSYTSKKPLWISPLAPPNEVYSEMNLIGEPSSVFTSIFKNINNPGIKNAGIVYISPKNGRFILTYNDHIIVDKMQRNTIIMIFFNPFYSKGNKIDVSKNLSDYCSLISNADPQCYCGNTELCVNAAMNGLADQLSASDREKIKNNCACFSSQCNYSKSIGNDFAKNQTNTCKDVSVCGGNFMYDLTNNVIQTSQNKTLKQQCNLIGPQPTNNPDSDPTNSPKSDSDPMKKIATTIAIIIIISIVLFLIKKMIK